MPIDHVKHEPAMDLGLVRRSSLSPIDDVREVRRLRGARAVPFYTLQRLCFCLCSCTCGMYLSCNSSLNNSKAHSRRRFDFTSHKQTTPRSLRGTVYLAIADDVHEIGSTKRHAMVKHLALPSAHLTFARLSGSSHGAHSSAESPLCGGDRRGEAGLRPLVTMSPVASCTRQSAQSSQPPHDGAAGAPPTLGGK